MQVAWEERGDRLEKANELYYQGAVFPNEKITGFYKIRGYDVMVDGKDKFKAGCTCPDFVYRAMKEGYRCKHILAAIMYEEGVMDRIQGMVQSLIMQREHRDVKGQEA